MLSITSQYLALYRRLAGDRSDTLLPVTGAQRRFLLVRSLDPSGRPDVVPMFFAFPSATVDPERLRAAASRLAARHTALRSRPDVVRGTPVLRVADPDVTVTRSALVPGESPADGLRRALASWDAQGPPCGSSSYTTSSARRTSSPSPWTTPSATAVHWHGSSTNSAPRTARKPPDPR